MTTYETIIVAQSDGIARLTLNRPDKLNSFTVRMHEEVVEALDGFARDGDVRVLLLTGAGRAFCAGQDLSSRKPVSDASEVDLGASLETYYNPLVRRIAALPFPVVCAVNGVAAGAGANIALAADIVIAARSARFIQSFAAIGLAPDAGGTWILPRLVGHARAMGLALTGQSLGAEQAEAWGLIWKVVDDETLGAEADALVARLAAAPTKALAAIKQAIRASWNAPLEQQLDTERDCQRILGRTQDYREGVAAFLEKRAPRFSGR